MFYVSHNFYSMLKDIQQRIPCGYATQAASAPRLQPWYSEEPSEEEIEAMKVRHLFEPHVVSFDVICDSSIIDIYYLTYAIFIGCYRNA